MPNGDYTPEQLARANAIHNDVYDGCPREADMIVQMLYPTWAWAPRLTIWSKGNLVCATSGRVVAKGSMFPRAVRGDDAGAEDGGQEEKECVAPVLPLELFAVAARKDAPRPLYV